MIIGIIRLNHFIFDAPHVKFCVCNVSMLPQRNLYRHTFGDTRVHKIIQKRFSLFFIDWFFSVIKGRLSTVPKIFVQCYKRATIGDYAWLTGPTFSSTWCMELSWFPRKLPAHVKFIVSTLPDQEYKCFPTLKVVCEICIHSNCVSDHFYCQRCGYQMVSGLDTRLRGLGASPDQRHHLCSVLAYTLRLSSCKLIY